MKKIYFVCEPASDPYAGADEVIEIYFDRDLAQASVDEYNKDKKYSWEKFYVSEREVIDGKDN